MVKPVTVISILDTNDRNSLVDPPVNTIIYNSDTTRIENTTNGGITWNQIANNTDLTGKLSTSLNNAQVYIGNASNIATPHTITGDFSLSNAGVSTLASTIAGNKTFTGLIKSSLIAPNSLVATDSISDLVSASGGTFNIGVTGNAGSVTNGVYTTGTQTIDGFKNFTSKLSVKAQGSVASAGSVATFQFPVSGAVATENYSINIVGASDNAMYVGVNKNSVTGTIPAFGSFIFSEYTNSTLTFCQGGVSTGTPGTPWMHLNSDATVTVDSLSINSLVSTDSQKKLVSSTSSISPTFAGLSITGSSNFGGFLMNSSNGNPTSCASSIASFEGKTPVIPGNIYCIYINKPSVDSLMMGVNKDTASGNIPGNTCFISTNIGALAFGRGNGSGFLNNLDMLIGPNGNITRPTSAAFNAQYTVAATNISGNGTNYTLTTSAEVYDQSGAYTPATGTFVAPVTGVYEYGGILKITNLVSMNNCVIAILVNGVTIEVYRANPNTIKDGSNLLTVQFSRNYKYNAGDTIQTRLTVSGGTLTAGLAIGTEIYATLIC